MRDSPTTRVVKWLFRPRNWLLLESFSMQNSLLRLQNVSGTVFFSTHIISILSFLGCRLAFDPWITLLVSVIGESISILAHSSLVISENLYRPLVTIPSKVLCYAALKDLFKYLPESKKDPTNVAVRQRLQIASWMSLWPMKLERYR